MQGKTKAKIEAMAEEYTENFCNDFIMWASPQQFQDGIHRKDIDKAHCKGATPWAEWCERLAKRLHEKQSVPEDELLKEYRQWLEER